MPGLLAYAAAGAIQGAGDGIVEEARNKREDSLRALENARQDSQRAENRAWQVEDRDLAYSRRSSGSGSGSGSDRTYRMTVNEIGRLGDELFGPDADDRNKDPAILESYVAEINSTMEANPGMRYDDARADVFSREVMTEGSDASGGDDWIPFNEKPAITPERTGTFSTSGLNAIPQSPTPQNSVAPSGAPNTGDIIDGYKFMGGDPSVEANWQKV